MPAHIDDVIELQREQVRISPWRSVIHTQRRLAMEVLMNEKDYTPSQCEVARRILANTPRGNEDRSAA